MRENHRFKETEALFGGVPCEGLSVHTEACINRVCPGEIITKSEIEICSDFYIVVYSFGVLSYFPFILDQCCALNDVPDECLGLCMEDEDTSVAERSAFTSICDKYQATVVKCTVEGGGIRSN